MVNYSRRYLGLSAAAADEVLEFEGMQPRVWGGGGVRINRTSLLPAANTSASAPPSPLKKKNKKNRVNNNETV